jgi:cobalt-zinc-cadmium efflux system outer membrane protein
LLAGAFVIAQARTEELASALPRLTLDAAVSWGLANNPELAAIRQQHGIAAAALVIARTYPFNPTYEAKVRHSAGPVSAGITNRVTNEHTILLELEVRGQSKYRRQEARATLSRTDNEIIGQEVSHALAIVRAFDTVIYRRDKLKLIEETIELNRHIAEQTAKLVEAGKLRPPDLVVARTEIDDTIAQASPARIAVTAAQYDLRRALGAIADPLELDGTLERALPDWAEEGLTETALQKRPEVAQRQAAVAEAEARVRLAIANRRGNPALGPTYELDPTRISMLGAQLAIPLPFLNQHKGEILQRQAEQSRAALDLRETEIAIQQDVHAAIAHVNQARSRVELYRSQVLPNLQQSFKDLEKLFLQGDPGLDALRVIDVRRKLLRARDGYLDALFDLDQAQTELAAAVGDPTLSYVADHDAAPLELPMPVPAQLPVPAPAQLPAPSH